MAEQVQALMERMVAPLRDLRDRGIFSEVSQSVSQSVQLIIIQLMMLVAMISQLFEQS